MSVEEDFLDALRISSLKIKVKPNSKKNKIEKISDYFVIFLKSKAENNKANLELEKYLSKLAGEKVELLIGKTSKTKVVRIKKN